MFEGMTNTQRIELAKAKMEKVIDHFLYVLELHANNIFVVYTPSLSSQIPASFAANAFNVFPRGMHQIEIVRLCALWDSADLQKENIPTVVELIDDAAIIQALADETRDHWAKQPVNVLTPPHSERVVAAIEQQMARDSNIQFGNERASEAKDELKQAIADARVILCSPRLTAVMNLRDKHLAHSLTATRREKRGLIPPMKYGDGIALLNDSIPIIERLFCWVNGKSFSIADSQRIDHKNAEALWSGCKFNVVR
jgi:hypothetical protein